MKPYPKIIAALFLALRDFAFWREGRHDGRLAREGATEEQVKQGGPGERAGVPREVAGSVR
jgi:hypothetical protein